MDTFQRSESKTNPSLINANLFEESSQTYMEITTVKMSRVVGGIVGTCSNMLEHLKSGEFEITCICGYIRLSTTHIIRNIGPWELSKNASTVQF